MEQATIIGIDLAKRSFQLHGARPDGSVAFRKKGLPQNRWAEWRTRRSSSDSPRARVLTAVKARRSAPPPLRGAHGLDAGSAHAPSWLLSDDDPILTPASGADDPVPKDTRPQQQKRIPFRNPRQFGVGAPK